MNTKVEGISYEQGGIGVANCKKRLDLLYPKKHTLTINDFENTFHVHLKIKLN